MIQNVPYTELIKICPFAQVPLTLLRNKCTTPPQFREALNQVSLLLATQAIGHLSLLRTKVNTPLEETDGAIVGGRVALVPIMRAGSGMLPAFQTFLPEALVWPVTISRDEQTLEPILTQSKIPHPDSGIQVDNHICFVLDPMLATGGSTSLAIQLLKDAGVKKIVYVGIFAAPAGLACLHNNGHSDVPQIVGVIDRQLNEHGDILPGCGYAGDRQSPIE